MRLISVLILAVMCFSWAISGEVAVDLDRAAMIMPDNEDPDIYGPRIAVHFSLPEVVDGADITFAELYVPLANIDFQYDGDGILEIQAQNISSDWSEENAADFNDVDSSTFYTYTIDLSAGEAIHMDITEFIKSLASEEADNFGLMLMPIKLDQNVFQFPRNIISLFSNSARVKIVYE